MRKKTVSLVTYRVSAFGSLILTMQPSGAFGAAVKSQCRLPASLINVHPPPLPMELPDGVHLKQQLYDGLRAWISVTHAGDLD